MKSLRIFYFYLFIFTVYFLSHVGNTGVVPPNDPQDSDSGVTKPVVRHNEQKEEENQAEITPKQVIKQKKVLHFQEGQQGGHQQNNDAVNPVQPQKKVKLTPQENKQVNPPVHEDQKGIKQTQDDNDQGNAPVQQKRKVVKRTQDDNLGNAPVQAEHVRVRPRLKDYRPKPHKIKKWAMLARAEACKEDIARVCSKQLHHNNFALLNCLQRDQTTADSLNTACQHHLWQYKRNLTRSKYFDELTNGVCKDDLERLPQCNDLPEGKGHRIPCLVEEKQHVNNTHCYEYLNRIGTIIFSDYRLVYKFVDACEADIHKLNCGRVSGRNEDNVENDNELPTSQGKTIDCLIDRVDLLDKKCKTQVLRVAELQSDDFHLDRPLFYACREDREHLCHSVEAGEGRVLACLHQHKFSSEISKECRHQLTKREKLKQRDYKVDFFFSKTCDPEIRRLNCTGHLHIPPGQHSARLGSALLCLEGMAKEGVRVTPECMQEVTVARKQLLQDYKITPEIVTNCRNDVDRLCKGGIERNGVTLHCLMDHYRQRAETPDDTQMLEPKCRRAIEDLVKVADAGENIEVDPVIHQACQQEIQAHCQDIQPGHGAIYTCLMRHFTSTDMNSICLEKLTELQYIVTRNFQLDDALFRACNKDAVRLCAAPKHWYQTQKGKNPHQGPIVFACLYQKSRKASEERPSRDCFMQIRRTIRERAVSLELEPRIYEYCLPDLAKLCVNKGEQILCLQDNLDDLQDDCKKAVVQFAREEDKEPTLNQLFVKSCAKMMETFCKDSLQGDADSGMRCLIENKLEPGMDHRCRSAIEHHQIVSLKDFHISHKFADACVEDVQKFCKDRSSNKAEVISCLSEQVTRAIMDNKPHKISDTCRAELRFNMLQQRETILLDPRLQEACQSDMHNFCPKVDPSKVVRCLHEHQSELSAKCHKRIFRRERQEFADERVDARLQRVCGTMIRRYCSKGNPRNVLDCLRKASHVQDDFSQRCRKVVYKRLKTRSRDYRLDPRLMRLCKHDLKKYCSKAMHQDPNQKDKEYQGRVVQCLKATYRKSKTPEDSLEESCERHVRGIIMEANLHFHLDPVLNRACKNEATTLCGQELEDTDGSEGDGRVIECLKTNLIQRKIKKEACVKEVARLVGEGQADVHVDPVLYHACGAELRSLCGTVPLGGGRQMSCLLWAKDDASASKHMSPSCRKQIQQRVELWETAAKIAPPDTLHDLAVQITTSQSRNYFLAVLASVVGCIFVIGLCCGRVTKKVRVDAKNK